MRAIVWFRQDLRLEDNPALIAACKDAEAVIPIYIRPIEKKSAWPLGGASKWWLHHSLKSLDSDLRKVGSKLIVRQGDCLETLLSIIEETGARRICWNRRYEPKSIEYDKKIKARLLELGYQVESFNGHLLYEPWEIKNKQGDPYQVYTAFWNQIHSMKEPSKPLNAPKQIPTPDKWPQSLQIDKLQLEPRIKWDTGLHAQWIPGAAEGRKKLKTFAREDVEHYASERDRPDHRGTSELSPYLCFGEISARMVWHALQGVPKSTDYRRQIVWRDFAYHLLYYFPQTPNKNLKKKFDAFPWQPDKTLLKAWRKGCTGYPVVDAGMRQLWGTGWMHNRVRMITASLLVKHFLIPWQKGAEWFWDTLVDADLANNTMGWQWVAGCGADAAPYFRIFNPVLQGERYDPAGDYVRRWVPELAGLPSKWIHKPWQAPDEILSKAGVKLDQNYPRPVVDHESGRRRALMAYEKIKGGDRAK
ncbi:MAG: deoxyribodipyrimidine photo-lyase [Candidatus Omnitrophica bacterium]|nr:deoxyribodipyrimidine photo-lyase [Candidatus Omnitrophota bacterium]